VPRKEEKSWRRYDSVQPNLLQPGTPDCPVVHRTVAGALGWLDGELAALGIGGATWLQITGLSGGAPDCPVSLQRQRPSTSVTNSSLLGKGESAAAKNNRTVRWCIGLSGESEPPEPTVTSAISRRRVARANGRLGTPDCPMCTGQCPVRQRDRRPNGRMRQIRKEIEHRTTTRPVRWCTGLSGAPLDRRHVLPSKLISNGS
jgi:hypothetical protein